MELDEKTESSRFFEISPVPGLLNSPNFEVGQLRDGTYDVGNSEDEFTLFSTRLDQN
jgi:hypothetical protein